MHLIFWLLFLMQFFCKNSDKIFKCKTFTSGTCEYNLNVCSHYCLEEILAWNPHPIPHRHLLLIRIRLITIENLQVSAEFSNVNFKSTLWIKSHVNSWCGIQAESYYLTGIGS